MRCPVSVTSDDLKRDLASDADLKGDLKCDLVLTSQGKRDLKANLMRYRTVEIVTSTSTSTSTSDLMGDLAKGDLMR